MSNPFVVKYVDFNFTSLLDADNKFHKSVRIKDAKNMAREANLDLVCFNIPKKGENPLCKIIDYGKWKYHNKKERKKQKILTRHEVKEIQLTPVIDTNDLNHKIGQIIGFLKHKDDVVVIMKFKGIHKKLYLTGEKLLDQVVGQCKEYGTEQHKKKNKNNISVRLVHT